jgi:hypothetical protein
MGGRTALTALAFTALAMARAAALSSVLDWHHLVTDGSEDGRQQDDKVWLDERRRYRHAQRLPGWR